MTALAGESIAMIVFKLTMFTLPGVYHSLEMSFPMLMH